MYSVTPDNLVIPGDASAYQTALRMMLDKGDYDAVIFIHTKGVSHKQSPKCIRIRNSLFTNTITDDLVTFEELFAITDKIGYVGYALNIYGLNYCSTITNDIVDVCHKYLPHEIGLPIHAFVPHTFFVCSGAALRKLYSIDDSFFTTNLNSRSAIESHLPILLSYIGYIPVSKYIQFDGRSKVLKAAGLVQGKQTMAVDEYCDELHYWAEFHDISNLSISTIIDWIQRNRTK